VSLIAWLDRHAVRIVSALIAIALLGWLLALSSCGPTSRPEDPPVPAQVEADRLGKVAEDDSLAAAGAQAQADLLDDQAKTAPSADQAAELKAAADAARLRAAIASARADAAQQLRAEALTRATAERAELQSLAERSATAAAQLEADRALQRDRRWSGIGIGGCIAAAVAMTICGLPAWAAIGLPAAGAGGLLWIAGWSSVPWLAWVVGLGIACLLLIGLAVLALYLAREWRRHADDADTSGRATADSRSLERQPRLLRPLITRLLSAAS